MTYSLFHYYCAVRVYEHFFLSRWSETRGHLMKQETKAAPKIPKCRHINREVCIIKCPQFALGDGLVMLSGNSSACSIASANQGDQLQLSRRHRCFVSILESWLGVGGGQSEEKPWLCLFLLLALQAEPTAEATHGCYLIMTSTCTYK